VEELLRTERDDRVLRDRLEPLALEPGFRAVRSSTWAPALYRRNAVLFRPFILGRLAPFTTQGWTLKPEPWTPELETWLGEVERAGEVELYRRLYAWKLGLGLGRRPRHVETTWYGDLLRRVRAARAGAERQAVLSRLDVGLPLDEETAVALYAIDPEAARPFVRKHLPFTWGFGGEKRSLWKRLVAAARLRSDDAFAQELFRRQAPVDVWRAEARRVCTTVRDPEALGDALEQIHPKGWVSGIGPGLAEVLEARGRDAFPYVVRHLGEMWRSIFGRDGYKPILALAEERGWTDLWAELLRTCARGTEFDDAVLKLVRDRGMPEDEVVARLGLLAGVSREWNFGPLGLAQVHALSDGTAVALYERFPDLLRGPFRPHVGTRWAHPFKELATRALAEGDDDLVDHLASRSLLYLPSIDQRHEQVADLLSRHYESLRGDPVVLARRASSVLTRVPAYSIHTYDRLIRENRLARLLFERSNDSVLADRTAVRDLLEAPEIHVQALAFRALALPDARARAHAAASLDLLLPTLLRPLHRRTRRLAFGALDNAAHDEGAAAHVLRRAKEAYDLPDRKYDKEALVGLMGRVLHRHPALRSGGERPRVFRERMATT
jgi:hypothetical protein